MNIDGSNQRVITTTLDRSVSDPIWAADSRAIYVKVEDRGVNKVDRVDLDGSVHEIASGMGFGEIDRPYAGGQYTASRTGVIAFTSGDPLHPNQIAVSSGGHVRTLTQLSSSLSSVKSSRAGSKTAGSLGIRPASNRCLDGHSAGFRSDQKISDDPRDPRRSILRIRTAIFD